MSKSNSTSLNTRHTHDNHQKHTEKTLFGFWTYLMTDLVLFATLFATYVVLRGNIHDGPAGKDIFDMPFVLTETMILLLSSFTIGLAMLASYRNRVRLTLTFLFITFALGATFLGMEIYEFQHLVHEGYSWQRSAFLSSFFTLIGTHGLHILAGLIWASVLFVQILKRKLTVHTTRRLALFSLFWHFLDIVWIFIFTIVYLQGVL